MVEAQGKQSSQVWLLDIKQNRIKPCYLCFAKAMEVVLGWILDSVLFSIFIIALEINTNSWLIKY